MHQDYQGQKKLNLPIKVIISLPKFKTQEFDYKFALPTKKPKTGIKLNIGKIQFKGATHCYY
jgi:hypothetical protein